jgi:hypothetical protein
MSNVVRSREDDDPQVRWPGYAPIDRAGAEIALELLERLEDESASDDEDDPAELAELANLENWARRGRPYRNLLAEYVKRARAVSPEAENAFLAVIGDLAALVMQGTVPDAASYAHMLEATGPDDDDSTR